MTIYGRNQNPAPGNNVPGKIVLSIIRSLNDKYQGHLTLLPENLHNKSAKHRPYRPIQPHIRWVPAYFTGVKAAGLWCWTLSSVYRWGYEWVKLYFSASYAPYGVDREKFPFTPTADELAENSNPRQRQTADKIHPLAISRWNWQRSVAACVLHGMQVQREK